MNMAKKTNERTGTLGFEDKLWAAADVLRNNMDPAEYKHVVLGLIFLKYISDSFEERRPCSKSKAVFLYAGF
jgi:type I restriction enzyme M protein